MIGASDDPVLASVDAYNNDPTAYANKYVNHLLDRPSRFASLFSSPARILDLGCGPGRDIRIFTELGHQPTGLELNPSFIEMATSHGEVITGDIRDVDSIFSPLTFDGVWAQASLVHLSATETRAVLRSLHSVLTSGGRLYACVPSTGETGWRDETDGRRWYTTWPGDSFSNEVAQAGFTIDEVTHGVFIEVWATKS
jgi:SAM-dependent methyltransferase